ncbi:hypothetical protein [Jiangella muralis]|uniref:hypothetical protein n=1 Tax=Jiangella muralis TaxID=702383 RepID=UPI00069CF53E|nr:hypothetical protein [Jiangella muralis]
MSKLDARQEFRELVVGGRGHSVFSRPTVVQMLSNQRRGWTTYWEPMDGLLTAEVEDRGGLVAGLTWCS